MLFPQVHPPYPPPDMSPFFLKQYVKSRHDVFEAYPQLLTEMALRLPYQIKKITDSSGAPGGHSGNALFGAEWHGVLCDYMAAHQTQYVRRQARKLLLFVCGSRDKYRELRDLHMLSNHMEHVRAVGSFRLLNPAFSFVGFFLQLFVSEWGVFPDVRKESYRIYLKAWVVFFLHQSFWVDQNSRNFWQNSRGILAKLKENLPKIKQNSLETQTKISNFYPAKHAKFDPKEVSIVKLPKKFFKTHDLSAKL